MSALFVKATAQFQSTLSVRRATAKMQLVVGVVPISIHALRKESDLGAAARAPARRFQSTLSVRRATLTASVAKDIIKFQSTLSVRRATIVDARLRKLRVISIHALRKESDLGQVRRPAHAAEISIHALRKESDYSYS